MCLKCLPFWEKNIEIFDDIEILLGFNHINQIEILVRYVLWEILFLKNLGYGLNLDTCVVSGSSENIYFISPKSGNAVSFKIGKKIRKKIIQNTKVF